jgi:hypothetical protein
VGLPDTRETGGDPCRGFRKVPVPHLAVRSARDVAGARGRRGTCRSGGTGRLPLTPDGRRSLAFAAAVLLFAVTGGSSTASTLSGRPRSRDRGPPPHLSTSRARPGPSGIRPSRAGPSSRGIILRCAPLPTSPRPSTPGHQALRSDAASVTRVPSPRFLTSSTACSGRGFRHVAAGTGSGVRRVSAGSNVELANELSDRVPRPLRRAHPSKASPRRQSVSHHCGRSPLVVRAPAARRPRSCSTPGSDTTDESVASSAVASG